MNDERAITTTVDTSIIEKVMLVGDLAQLPPPQRVEYYNAVCRSLNLNPLTRPFEYIILDGKMTLYARRDATDQLRKNNGVSITIVSRERIGDVYVVTARAIEPNGRTDEATGVVPLVKEGGDWKKSQTGKSYFAGNGEWVEFRGSDLANALMKAETKAKRRVTLSICGLGWTDETELETIASAKPVKVVQETGEIVPENGKPNGRQEPPPADVVEGDIVDEQPQPTRAILAKNTEVMVRGKHDEKPGTVTEDGGNGTVKVKVDGREMVVNFDRLTVIPAPPAPAEPTGPAEQEPLFDEPMAFTDAYAER